MINCKLSNKTKLTLFSSGENNINNVSKTTLIVSTSSASFRMLEIKSRSEPDATLAGYVFAKLLNPRIAALRSSNNVALWSLPESVVIASVAVCLAGAWDSSMRNILNGDHGHLDHNLQLIHLGRKYKLASFEVSYCSQ